MSTIWYLVKFCSDEEYADQFINGKMYLNKLSYFKRLEQADDGRPDEHEAIAFWWQPDDLVMNLAIPGIGATQITRKDLAAPVSMSYDRYDELYVFCMYAITTTGFEIIDGKIEYPESQSDELRKQLEIDERCTQFGRYAVITPFKQFMDQVVASLRRQGYRFRAKLVEYYDDKIFHGKMENEDIPFRKQKRFSYQREFRVCVQPKIWGGSHALTLDIGSIRHITGKTDSTKLNSLLSIDSIKR
jgi:hypothetical protein